jgi:AAA family ATP:ADP antiporter
VVAVAADVAIIGVVFFIWVGIFSLSMIAQFWAFANDLYSKDQGKRLFAIIAGGAALGAVLGAKLAKPLYKAIGPFAVMLLAAGILIVCLGITWLVHRSDDPAAEKAGERDRPLAPGSGVSLMLKDRYLLLVGLLSLVKNWVNTTGEYILDRRLLEVAKEKVGSGTAELETYIAGFKSDYFTYVNVTVMVLQFFAVSRIVRYIGVRKSLFFLPLIALTAYGTMAIVPILTVILIGKIAENSTDYSLEKTAEQMLFLVTSREAKYKVKAIVDTFAVRLGDVLSAGLVWAGSRLAFSTMSFIVADMVLIVGWLGVVVALVRTRRVQEDAGAKAKAGHVKKGVYALARAPAG